MTAKRIVIVKKGSLSKEDIRKIEKNFSIVVEGNPEDIKIVSTLYDGETTELMQRLIRTVDVNCGPDSRSSIYRAMLDELTKSHKP